MGTDPTLRNPAHPQALRLSDVQPGVSAVIYNRALGVLDRGSFTGTPFKDAQGYWCAPFETELRHSPMSLADAGIVPYLGGHWNETNFTVPPEYESELPAPNPNRFPVEELLDEDKEPEE